MTIGKDCGVKNIKRYKPGKDKKPRRGKWIKGQSGNPLGRPARPEIVELRNALAVVKHEKGRLSFLEDFVRKAYDNKDYAVTLFKKIVPSEAFITKQDQRIVVNFKGKLSDEAVTAEEITDGEEES